MDDVLVISHDPERVMKHIQDKFEFKGGKCNEIDMYLGARIGKKTVDGTKMWTMSSQDYLKNAILEVESKLKKEGKSLPKKAKVPMCQSYRPELDSSEELEGEDITYYQELMGILRWSMKIGRVDIHTEVSMLSAHQASPRRGHLSALYQIFAYLKQKPKLSLYFDSRFPNIDYTIFS